MKSSTAERLRLIMEERGLKQVDILELCKPYCEQFGMKLNRNDLSQYVSGKVTPKQDKLSILAMALNVNEVWLMGYDVPPGRLDLDILKSNESTSSFDRSLRPDERILLNNYNVLNDAGKAEAQARIQEMTELRKYTQESQAKNA